MTPTEIRIELIKKGWKQKDAAAVLGVHEQYISQLCRGARKSFRMEMRIRALPSYRTYLKGSTP